AQRVEQRREYRALVGDFDRGTYHEAQPRESALVFFLEQLVVYRGAAEARRQHLFENRQHFAADKRHALAGELPKAPDLADVLGIAVGFKRTAARARLDHAVIVELDIEHDLRRGRQKAREAESVHVDIEAGHPATVIDERKPVLEKMHVVAVERAGAAHADAAAFAEVIRRVAPCASGGDRA